MLNSWISKNNPVFLVCVCGITDTKKNTHTNGIDPQSLGSEILPLRSRSSGYDTALFSVL